MNVLLAKSNRIEVQQIGEDGSGHYLIVVASYAGAHLGGSADWYREPQRFVLDRKCGADLLAALAKAIGIEPGLVEMLFDLAGTPPGERELPEAADRAGASRAAAGRDRR